MWNGEKDARRKIAFTSKNGNGDGDDDEEDDDDDDDDHNDDDDVIDKKRPKVTAMVHWREGKKRDVAKERCSNTMIYFGKCQHDHGTCETPWYRSSNNLTELLGSFRSW